MKTLSRTPIERAKERALASQEVSKLDRNVIVPCSTVGSPTGTTPTSAAP